MTQGYDAKMESPPMQYVTVTPLYQPYLNKFTPSLVQPAAQTSKLFTTQNTSRSLKTAAQSSWKVLLTRILSFVGAGSGVLSSKVADTGKKRLYFRRTLGSLRSDRLQIRNRPLGKKTQLIPKYHIPSIVDCILLIGSRFLAISKTETQSWRHPASNHYKSEPDPINCPVFSPDPDHNNCPDRILSLSIAEAGIPASLGSDPDSQKRIWDPGIDK